MGACSDSGQNYGYDIATTLARLSVGMDNESLQTVPTMSFDVVRQANGVTWCDTATLWRSEQITVNYGNARNGQKSDISGTRSQDTSSETPGARGTAELLPKKTNEKKHGQLSPQDPADSCLGAA